MNILCVIPAYRPGNYDGPIGGGEISNRLLFEGLSARGHAVSVVAVHGSGEKIARMGGVDVTQARLEWLPRHLKQSYGYLRYYRVASRVARRFRPDIVLAATVGLPVALRIARGLGLRCGLIIRAFEHFPEKYGSRKASYHISLPARIRELMLGSSGLIAVQAADFLVPNSEYMKRVCNEHVGELPSYVVYPPIAVTRTADQARQSIRRVAMVGTGEHKGTAVVKALAPRFPALCFTILGVPATQSSIDVARNVTLVSWGNVPREFDRADIVIVPSIWPEPFGRVAVEGLAAGAIVLVSGVGGLPEAVGYETALLVEPHDSVEAWEHKIQNVILDPAPYVAACVRAKARIERFGLEAQVGRLEQALQTESQANCGGYEPNV